MEWIKFNGKNVPSDITLLGNFEKSGIRTFKYDPKNDLWDLGLPDKKLMFSGGLTHWMPLPNLPENGE